jgi:hypothetical protein
MTKTVQYKQYTGARIPRSVKGALFSILIILFILLAAGFGYAWFSERTEAEIADTASSATSQIDLNPIKPRKADPRTAVGASVQTLSTPVKPGDNSVITVRTKPGASCTIQVVYDEVVSSDSGLTPKHANDFGVVSWSWTVGKRAPPGTWPIGVTCAQGEKSAFVRGDQVVKR